MTRIILAAAAFAVGAVAAAPIIARQVAERHALAGQTVPVVPLPDIMTTPHRRDRLGICQNCGSGVTAIDLVDGENPCPGVRVVR